MTEIKVRGTMYKLPEGFTVKETSMRTYYVSPEGERFTLIPVGYQGHNDIPFLEYRHPTGLNKRIPLEAVNPVEEPKVKTGLAWELSMKLLKMLMDDGKLAADYEERLKVMDAEFDKDGDRDLKEYVMTRIQMVVNVYRKTKVWDFTLLGK